MDPGDTVWYVTDDTKLPPYKAKILRVDNKSGNTTEYVVRRTTDNMCNVFEDDRLYTTFEDAKEAKLAIIQGYITQLQRDADAIRKLDEATSE